MISADSIFGVAKSVADKATELGKSAVNEAGEAFATVKDKVITTSKTDVEPIVNELLRAIETTKTEHLGERFKEILEKHV